MRRFAHSVLAVLCVVLGACSGSTPGAPSPPVSPSASGVLVCPANILRLLTDGDSISVSYPLPTLGGGQPADKVVCSPRSGSRFAVGTTTVTCVASEAPALVGTCSFDVAVVRPRLSKTRFLAFGDSLTAGFVSCDPCLDALLADRQGGRLGSLEGWRSSPFAIMPEQSYPTRLHELLTRRYLDQAVSVGNLGVSGERTDQGIGRFAAELDRQRPEVVLLLEGVNDLILTARDNDSRRIARIADNLRDMVGMARSRGIEVLLGTLAPVTDARDATTSGLKAGIELLNIEIERIAVEAGAPVVDVFAALNADPGLIGEDGLHPTGAGYRRMAETFLAAIIARFEVVAR